MSHPLWFQPLCNSNRFFRMHLFTLYGNKVLIWTAFLIELFLYFGPQTVLYLHSDSIHHSYLNKKGIVTVTKFNMNMVRKALNLMLPRWQFGLPIALPVTVNKQSQCYWNKKFQNLKTMWFWNLNLKCDLCRMSSVVTNNFLPECSLDIVG